MGIFDALRSGTQAMGRMPRQFAHSLSRWQPTLEPNSMQVPDMPVGPIQIGEDPNTGEPIFLEPSNVGGFEAPMPGAQATGERRVGPSRLGNFMQNILPRLAEGAIAGAATQNVANGGPVDFFRAMDASRARGEQRDMLAYNMARQQRQDQIMEAERLARLAEDQANAERLRRPPQPARQSEPTNLTQYLLRKLESAKTPEEAKLLFDQINAQGRFIRDGAGNIFDSQEQKFIERPTAAPKESLTDAKVRAAKTERESRAGRAVAEYGYKIGSPEYIQFVETGKPFVPKPPPAPRRGPAVTATALRQQSEAAASKLLIDAGQDPDAAIALARKEGAPLAVINMLIEHKRKATPPANRPTGAPKPKSGSIVDGLSSGGGSQKWKQFMGGN
jgi:hypothetical protein